MNKENKYDIKSAKESVLNNVAQAYYALGRLRGSYEAFEEELIVKAMNKVLDEDTNDFDQFLELMEASYMLRTLSTDLRQRGSEQVAQDQMYPF